MNINEYYSGRHVICDRKGVEKYVYYSRSEARACLIRNGKNGWYVKNSSGQIIFRLI